MTVQELYEKLGYAVECGHGALKVLVFDERAHVVTSMAIEVEKIGKIERSGEVNIALGWWKK